MIELKTPLDKEVHRRLATDLFNFTWTLMEKETRTPMEDNEMIHSAHASRLHWGIAGTWVHFARGEWQISRVYSILQRFESALYHAQRCVDHCVENELGAFDLAYAYEAMARAHAMQSHASECKKYMDKSTHTAAGISSEEERNMLLNDLMSIQGMGMGSNHS